MTTIQPLTPAELATLEIPMNPGEDTPGDLLEGPNACGLIGIYIAICEAHGPGAGLLTAFASGFVTGMQLCALRRSEWGRLDTVTSEELERAIASTSAHGGKLPPWQETVIRTVQYDPDVRAFVACAALLYQKALAPHCSVSAMLDLAIECGIKLQARRMEAAELERLASLEDDRSC